jgi:hypothetical protein
MTQSAIKIDFLIIGTQKGGTTSLDAYLRDHPQICMAKQKEVHFFDNEDFFQKENLDYTYYHKQFSLEKRCIRRGESTPIYMYWENAPKRIWEYNPKMKLIIVLRNPIERAYSHWNMERQREAEKLSFYEAIVLEKERLKEAYPLQHRVYSYIDRGFYTKQLQRIWKYFPKNHTLIFKTEELKNRPKKILDKVTNFLEIDPFAYISQKKLHTLSYDSPLQTREKEILKNTFLQEIRKLEKLLGWDCSEWLEI